ncbi:cytosine permease [Tsukamurella sp. 8F]|uniref:purine-cytosine permease family protein n=1 Tax=unclassified Tsukamurella TaxID=2633480 RepID=UPI0023B93D5C|nr:MULTISPECIES: cytosine permease [unclassified Tsukamurella]MDF0528764.1 cytosine permease [Tsukamurella sp. 8J]MDF0586599.1 cytosine permease [Tsukamurella sp. 8F]
MSRETTSVFSTSAASDVLSSFEQRGIEPVPVDERTGTPRQLFWVWFAANISILGIPLGATLVALGLNLWQSAIVAAVGAVGSFAVVGAVSIAGRIGGAPSLTLSRAVFGVRGNVPPTLVSLISRWGWETVNTTTAAFALLSLSVLLFGTAEDAHDVPAVAITCILVFVLLTVAVSGMGHAFLVTIQKYATWVFGALNVFVAAFLVATIDWKAVFAAPSGPVSAMVIGIGIVAGGTGIGWANSGADMSRYQSPTARASHLVMSAAVGAGIPLVLLIGLGSLLSAGDPSLASAADPIAAIRGMLPEWVAVPYLIAAFGGLLLSNHLSVYSAGLTLITLGVPIKRVYAVCADVVITTIGSIYFMLFASSFYGPFIAFISLLAVPITAWAAVFLVGLALRPHYDDHDLMNLGRTSGYWYRGGVEWRAVSAWCIAILVGYLFTRSQVSANEVWFTGAFFNTWIGRNGLGWVVAFILGGLLYFALGSFPRRAGRADAGRQS